MIKRILLLTFLFAGMPFFSEATNALEIGKKDVPDSTSSKKGIIEGLDKFIYNSSNSKWKLGIRFGGNINKQIVENSPLGSMSVEIFNPDLRKFPQDQV